MANAYDAMMLTALAIKAAGSTDGDAIREGFYKIAQLRRPDQDLQASRSRRATTTRINENDYVWTQFIDNQILPVGMKK